MSASQPPAANLSPTVTAVRPGPAAQGTAILAMLSSLLAAPCIAMLGAAPLGLTSVLAAAGGIWIDERRYWFMGLSAALLALTFLADHRMRRVRAALAVRMGIALPDSRWSQRLVWIAAAVVIILIALELSLDHHMADG